MGGNSNAGCEARVIRLVERLWVQYEVAVNRAGIGHTAKPVLDFVGNGVVFISQPEVHRKLRRELDIVLDKRRNMPHAQSPFGVTAVGRGKSGDSRRAFIAGRVARHDAHKTAGTAGSGKY